MKDGWWQRARYGTAGDGSTTYALEQASRVQRRANLHVRDAHGSLCRDDGPLHDVELRLTEVPLRLQLAKRVLGALFQVTPWGTQGIEMSACYSPGAAACGVGARRGVRSE